MVQKIAFCDAHAPADYLAENRGRQSPGEKLNNARRVLAKKRSAAPVISIPTIPTERWNTFITLNDHVLTNAIHFILE